MAGFGAAWLKRKGKWVFLCSKEMRVQGKVRLGPRENGNVLPCAARKENLKENVAKKGNRKVGCGIVLGLGLDF